MGGHVFAWCGRNMSNVRHAPDVLTGALKKFINNDLNHDETISELNTLSSYPEDHEVKGVLDNLCFLARWLHCRKGATKLVLADYRAVLCTIYNQFKTTQVQARRL